MLGGGWIKCNNCGVTTRPDKECEYCGHNPHTNALLDEIRKLKEENEKMHALLGELSRMEKLGLAKTIADISKENEKLKTENEQLKKSVDSYIAQHVKSVAENTQLKSNAEQLTGISGQLKQENKELKQELNDKYGSKRYKIDTAPHAEHCEHSGVELGKVERKPHKCPVCGGAGKNPHFILTSNPPLYADCGECNGTGIVWEGE